MPPSNGPLVCLGIGLSGGAEAGQVVALAEAVLARSGFGRERLKCIATIDRRRDDPVLSLLAAHFGTAIRHFDAATLEAETPRLKNPSETLFARIGCHGVAEAAALAAAGGNAVLVVEKTAGRHATAAVAVCSGDILTD